VKQQPVLNATLTFVAHGVMSAMNSPDSPEEATA
jgi:hypothetical protein